MRSIGVVVFLLALVVAVFLWIESRPEPSEPGRETSQAEARPTPSRTSSSADQPVELAEPLAGRTALDLSAGSEAGDDASLSQLSNSGADAVDESGLSHDQKIKKVLGSYERFERARGQASEMIRAQTEYLLVLDCAVTILRSKNRVQYTLDVDDGVSKGFHLPEPTEESAIVAADNGKYEIFVNEFPALSLARDRMAIAEDESVILPPLNEDQRKIYHDSMTSALDSLGVRGYPK